ncbi:MAG: hypothetical protein ACI855_004044 [Myxococcota bacterium]
MSLGAAACLCPPPLPRAALWSRPARCAPSTAPTGAVGRCSASCAAAGGRSARRSRSPTARSPPSSRARSSRRCRAATRREASPGSRAPMATTTGSCPSRARPGRGRAAKDEGGHRELPLDTVEPAVVAGLRRQRRGVPDVREGDGAARGGSARGPPASGMDVA